MHNKAPVPDVFAAEFYQHFWEVTGVDLLKLINYCYHGKLDLVRFNYGVLTLLPNYVGAETLQ